MLLSHESDHRADSEEEPEEEAPGS